MSNLLNVDCKRDWWNPYNINLFVSIMPRADNLCWRLRINIENLRWRNLGQNWFANLVFISVFNKIWSRYRRLVLSANFFQAIFEKKKKISYAFKITGAYWINIKWIDYLKLLSEIFPLYKDVIIAGCVNLQNLGLCFALTGFEMGEISIVTRGLGSLIPSILD
jgi:hypothetical protein